jgi:hypothetical protein
MPRVKRLFKPGVDDPQAIFKYGKECGAEEERERIINKILNDKEQRWITNDFDIDEIALRRFIYDS